MLTPRKSELETKIEGLTKKTEAIEKASKAIFEELAPELVQKAKQELFECKIVFGREEVDYFIGMGHDSDIGRNGEDYPSYAHPKEEVFIPFKLGQELPTKTQLAEFVQNIEPTTLEQKLKDEGKETTVGKGFQRVFEVKLDLEVFKLSEISSSSNLFGYFL